MSSFILYFRLIDTIFVKNIHTLTLTQSKTDAHDHDRHPLLGRRGAGRNDRETAGRDRRSNTSLEQGRQIFMAVYLINLTVQYSVVVVYDVNDNYCSKCTRVVWTNGKRLRSTHCSLVYLIKERVL